ncbi:MAG: hypothetical protein U1F43_04665 [Myxococcota bacterium]
MNGLTRRVVVALALAASGAVTGCSLALEWNECSAAKACPGGFTCDGGECVADTVAPTLEVRGTIDRDTTWTKDNVYLLKEVIFVAPGARLTIKAGTRVLGEQASALVVRDGGFLDARGTLLEPVVFTSAQPVGQRAPADWGGVVLLGHAPVNQPDASFEAIEDPLLGRFGGDDVTWACGAIQFARIEFAGHPILADKEYNGLTLGGCGSETLIDHVQIHLSADDGVQIYGGTVGIKHIVMTQVQKDGLDWENGWRGTAQYIVIQQGEQEENAFESVNNDDDPNAMPRSEPTIYNFTLIGSGGEGGNQCGLWLESGAGGHFVNGIVIGQSQHAIDIVGAETAALLQAGVLEITHSAFYDVGVGGVDFLPKVTEEVADEEDDGNFDEDQWFRKVDYGNVFGTDPHLPDPHNLVTPSWVPPANTLPGVARRPPITLDQKGEYLGAFEPGAAAWSDGWTAFPAN